MNVSPYSIHTQLAPANFVDSMDEANYVIASLSKPMGIVFEENDEEYGGIFVLSLSEGGNAENDGKIKPGDQLVAVNDKKVAGLSFDDALGAIVEANTEKTRLVFFRGDEVQLYGPTGASKEWLDEFISKA
jgi:C-terminal processing protease CtpA/Prc